MKVEEIMVGDLLRVNSDNTCITNYTIVTVRAIDEDIRQASHIGCAFCSPLDDRQIGEEIWCDYLDPIPLTHEILKKNEFSKTRLMGEQRHFTYYLGPGLSMLAIYDTEFSICIGENARIVKYVH
jgi:hypothetical protein